MGKVVNKRQFTDEEVRRKAVKLVISHLKKKMPESAFQGEDSINDWIQTVEEFLSKEEFVVCEYLEMRKELNDIIERIVDDELRFKLRDSWYSLGKAIYKKAKIN
jgi:pantothenate synthetase